MHDGTFFKESSLKVDYRRLFSRVRKCADNSTTNPTYPKLLNSMHFQIKHPKCPPKKHHENTTDHPSSNKN
jgi:hypothetical protein